MGSARVIRPETDESATCASVHILADAGENRPSRGRLRRGGRAAAPPDVVSSSGSGPTGKGGGHPGPPPDADRLLGSWCAGAPARARGREAGPQEKHRAGSGTRGSHLAQEPVKDVSVKDVPYWNTTVDPG